MFNGITSGWIATFGRRSSPDATSPIATVRLASRGAGQPGLRPEVPPRREPRRPHDSTDEEPGSPAIEIVGLVADAVYRDVREPTLPTAYVPLSQSVDSSLVEDPT